MFVTTAGPGAAWLCDRRCPGPCEGDPLSPVTDFLGAQSGGAALVPLPPNSCFSACGCPLCLSGLLEPEVTAEASLWCGLSRRGCVAWGQGHASVGSGFPLFPASGLGLRPCSEPGPREFTLVTRRPPSTWVARAQRARPVLGSGSGQQYGPRGLSWESQRPWREGGGLPDAGLGSGGPAVGRAARLGLWGDDPGSQAHSSPPSLWRCPLVWWRQGPSGQQ